jgi:hypothetical protein
MTARPNARRKREAVSALYPCHATSAERVVAKGSASGSVGKRRGVPPSFPRANILGIGGRVRTRDVYIGGVGGDRLYFPGPSPSESADYNLRGRPPGPRAHTRRHTLPAPVSTEGYPLVEHPVTRARARARVTVSRCVCVCRGVCVCVCVCVRRACVRARRRACAIEC